MQHYIRYIIFSLMLFMGSSAYAETPLQDGKEMDQYATIAGGWHLNEHCKFLNLEERLEFEWYISNLTISMAKKIPQQLLFMIQKSAQSTAQHPKFSKCGQGNKDLILQTFEMSKKLNKDMTGKAYQKGISDRQYLLGKYSNAIIGIKIDHKCDFLPKNIISEVHEAYKTITKALEKKFPQTNEIQNNQKLEDFVKSKSCNHKKNHLYATKALIEIRALEKSLGL